MARDTAARRRDDRSIPSAAPTTTIDRPAFRTGLRAGAPFAAASFLLSVSFGALAVDTGFPTVAAIVMSVIVFAGSAQFAAVSIVAAGGGLGSAVIAAALVNSRFLPMGIALGPSLPGGPVRRGIEGQAVVDASWAMAARPDGSFDRSFLFGSTAIQYVAWILGTALGALAGGALGDTDRFGLDAVYPTFFLVLLIHELRSGRGREVAAGGALIALALIPFAPPGAPVLAASLAALIGLRTRGADEPADRRADGDRATLADPAADRPASRDGTASVDPAAARPASRDGTTPVDPAADPPATRDPRP